jgi:MFS family permease
VTLPQHIPIRRAPATVPYLDKLMPAAGFHKVVWPLAVAETIVWAGLYYSFPALLLQWEADPGWSKAELTGAFTLSVLVSALLAPFSGRVIDRALGPHLFAGSAALGAVLLMVLTQVTQLWQFYAVWTAIGVVMAGCLYEPCFALLTRTMGPRARRAITAVSLVAGLAGTVSFPAAHYLSVALGWRGALVVFAAVILGLAVPLMWYAAKLAERSGGHQAPASSLKAATAARVAARPAFWALSLGFAMLALNHGMILTHTLPLLNERGLDPALAVLAISCIGPMQVAGRIVMMSVEHRVSSMAIAIACQVSLAVAAVALMGAAAWPVLLAPFVMLQGAGNGVTSIIRPVLTAELLGRADFGVISGLTALVYISGFALGPTAGSLLWQTGGYNAMLVAAIAMAGAGIVLLAAARRFSAAAPHG